MCRELRQPPNESTQMSSRTRRTVVFAAVAALALLPATARADHVPLEPTAVASFIDTGINPYHITFRDSSPRAYEHPSTYLPGYPADAEAIELTLGTGSYASLVKADCDVWKDVKPGKLYWFPGTKIVGAISFNPATTVNCSPATPTGATILDYNGHGTMVASRGAATAYGACKECRIVAIQFPGSVNLVSPSASNKQSIDPIRWAANNASWIDVQSNSWGPIVTGWEPTGQAGVVTANPELVRAVEEVSAKHPAFWASGNGAAFRGGVLGHPTPATAHLTPSAIVVGGHDSGQVNVWPGFPPHVVSDSCNSWAAQFNHTTQSGDSVGGGTSAATPFVAGGATEILLDARRILGDTRTGVRTGGVMAEGPSGLVASGPLADGVFTMAELRRVLFTTATARPERQYEDGPPCGTGQFGPTPVLWKDVPADYPEYLHIGYGAVDRPSIALAARVLRGTAALPVRADTDQYFAVDDAVGGATHQVFSRP